MAKKDILDFISRPAAGDPRQRRGEPVPPSRTKGDAEITRVSSGVVRRRRANEAPEPEPVVAPAVVVRKRPIVSEEPARPEPAAARGMASSRAEPVEPVQPVEETHVAEESAPDVDVHEDVAAPAVEVHAEAAPPAPVEEVAAEPISPAPAEVAPPEVEAAPVVEVPAAPVVAAEASAAPVEAEEPVKVAPAPRPEARPADARAPEGRPEARPADPRGPVTRRQPEPSARATLVRPPEGQSAQRPGGPPPGAEGPPRFRGLGSAVVVPPPGYDPTNPEAFRAQQRRPTPPPAQQRGPSYGAAGSGPSSSTSGGPPSQAGAGQAGRGDARGRRRVAEADPAPAPQVYVDDPANRGRRTTREAANAMEQALRMRPRRRKKAVGPTKSLSPQPKAQKRKIRIDGAISVGQLAHELSVKAPMVIKKLMELGTLATVNEMLDYETATLVAGEFEYEIENVGFDESEYLQHVTDAEHDEKKAQRPPVVTIMGHVDHGKTTLLDSIRKAKVAAGEAGGITQHIGAYQVERDGRTITFLDTPGHAAFSSMRARGASLTDIIVLVVAADDGVQPQTVEAINHARAANVPVVVAINKIDKAGVNPDAIKQRLGEYNLVPEEWGGETLFAEVSALKHLGIDDLLETILLQADVLDIQANAERHAEGAVIEAKVERGRGPVASVLVQQGTLKLGDHVVLGTSFGKVRAMMDFRGKPIKTAGPSTPVEIFGLSELPNVGDTLSVVANEKNARTLAEHRAQQEREAQMAKTRRRTVDDMRRMAGADELKTLFVVLKADVQGSLEALKNALMAIRVDGCEIRVLHDGVGAINESDVNLVSANDGLLVGFNVKVDSRARKVADEMGVKPEIYDVIYDVIDRAQGALTGMLEPVYEEVRLGTVEVRAIFNISKVGQVAGSYVLDGKIARSSTVRVMRDGREVWKGDVGTLKRFKDDVRDVAAGYECGVALSGYNDLQVGDLLEAYSTVRVDPGGKAGS